MKSSARSSVPVMRSEGQRMLLHVTGSLKAIADAAGCKSPQSVYDWRTGRKAPGPEARAKMFAAFGIPVRTWSMRPGGESSTSTALAVDDASTSTDAPVPTTLEHCMQLLRVISLERRQPDLLASERVKLAQAEAQILALRHRLECEAQLSEDRFVREHPAWARMKRVLVKALVAHPAAAQAVADALADLAM